MVQFCKEHGSRLTILLHVQPRARKTEVVGVHGDALKIKVAAPPVDDAANEEIVGFFSTFFGVARSKVRLLQGGKARRKVLEVDGVTTTRLTELLLKHGLLTIRLG